MQKQEVAILSAQFSGFLKLVEGLSNDDIGDLMNEIYEIIENTVKLHQGKVNLFTGEKLLVVFNGTLTKPSQAVNTISELRSQLIDYTEKKKLSGNFGLKTGLAFGEVILGESGSTNSKQSTIMGEAVNHANRICEFAGVDQVLVDGNIYNSTEKQFDYQSLEPIPIKGTEDTLAIFELTGKKRTKLELKTSGERKIVSEMVGRTREAEQLEGLIKNLVEGKGTIVNIVGKAGIGKSRLMDEMKVQPIMEKVLLLEGRAIATGQQLSYHPIANLIRNWAGILEDDLPTVSAQKLEQGIRQIAPEQSDEIFAFVGKMMGLPLTGKYHERVKGIEGEALEKLILKNLRDLIIAATKDKPRIYLIEDAHWADSSSIKMFESLYKLSQNYPVMFINVMRPGYKDTGDYILKYLVDKFPVDHTTITIKPLEEKESDNLIKNLLRNSRLPSEIQQMIIRKTEGNPFFIEEIIRSFIDEGIIEVKEGHFVVTEKINNVNIPETINDAILSRVDKLDEKTRELLNTASVMGRNFYYKVLEEATDTIEELDERLSYLSEVQLITETKKKEEIEYLFKHALAQQLTYDAMMMQSRKQTHLKIARSIEKVFAKNINKFYGTLAHHYQLAEDKEKSYFYLYKAGDESKMSGAASEALNFYERALSLFSSVKGASVNIEEKRDLEIKIAFAYNTIGRNDIAIEKFEDIFENYFNYKLPGSKLRMTARAISSAILFYYIMRNKSKFFRKKMNEDTSLFVKLALNWGFALVHHNSRMFALKGLPVTKFLSFYDIGRSDDGMSFFAGSVTLFNLTGISLKTAHLMLDYAKSTDINKNSNAWFSYRMALRMQDYFTGKWETDHDFADNYKLIEKKGSSWTFVSYIFYSGLCCVDRGDHAAFIDATKKLEEVDKAFDFSLARALRIRLLALGYLKFRQFDKLIELKSEGIQYLRTTMHTAMLHVFHSVLVLMYVYQGKLENARYEFSVASEFEEQHKRAPIYRSQFLIAKIRVMLMEIEIGSYSNISHRSLIKLANQLIKISGKMVANLSEAYLLKAMIYQQMNKHSKALQMLQKSILSGETYKSLPELSRSYFETGKFLSDPNNKYKELNGHPASYYLDKAKTMFEEMDLQWDLEEFRKFVSGV